MAIAGNKVSIKATGTAITMTDEPMQDLGNDLWEIINPVKQIIDWNTPVVVEDNNVPVLSANYVVNYLLGQVQFSVPPTGTVTITGKYLPASLVACAHEHSIDESATLDDVTCYLDTHKKRIKTALFASGTLKQFEIADTFFRDKLLSGDTFVLEVNPDKDDTVLERFAIKLDKASLTAVVDKAQDRTVSFASDGEYYRLTA